MAMEKQPFEDVSPIKNGDVPLLLMNIPVVYICILHSLLETVFSKTRNFWNTFHQLDDLPLKLFQNPLKTILIHRYPLFSCMKKCLEITKKYPCGMSPGFQPFQHPYLQAHLPPCQPKFKLSTFRATVQLRVPEENPYPHGRHHGKSRCVSCPWRHVLGGPWWENLVLE